jgi:hypothetical protein
MKTETKNCYHCDAELVLGDNWTEARKAQAKYLCKKCWHSRDMYVDNRYISKKHPLFKPGKYKSFGDAAFSALQKDIQIKEGYVYVITNPAWPEWVKIGMAIDAEDRLNGYQTSSPMRDYQLVHAIATPDRAKAERVAHKAAAMCGEKQGEWFKIANEEAVTILQHIKETEDEQKRESTN